MDGLMKGIIKTGIIFSAVLVAALAVLYVLPAGADIILSSTSVNPSNVDTKQNVTLNFSITVGGGGTGVNVTVNVSGTGFAGLQQGNIVCPVNVSGGSQFNASVVDQDIASCFRNHSSQNLTGAFNFAIKGLSAPVKGQTANFTFNVTGNDSTSNLTTISVTVLLLNANATLDVSSVNAGAKQNYTFTVANNGTDSVDRVNITYNANFADPAAGDVVCPDPGGAGIWTPTVDTTNNIVTCTKGGGANLLAGDSATLKVENWSASNDARVKTFDVNVRGSKGGNFTVVSVKPSVSVYGNLSITGTNRALAVNQTGTRNLTMISFNFSATGEAMNISEIIVTRNGTVTDADIVSVALYNSTQENAMMFNETGNIDPLAVTTSAPTNGRYNFSGLALKVNTSQIIIVVVNLSSTATGGKSLNFSIEGASDVATVGAHSGQAIAETLSSTRSSSTGIYGTLSVAGTNRVATTTQIGTTNVTVITFNLTAVGEQMNISEIIITRNGTSITDADIIEVKLYNTTDPDATAVNSTQTPLAVNTSAPSANGRYNFSGLNLKVPVAATGQILLVSFNISSSATGGRAFNASIEGAADIVTNASVSGAAITETLSGQRSSSSTIYGTLAITGGSRLASSTQIGSTNVTVISFNFTATGEAVNITGLNITFNGTFLNSDILRVALYNSSAANAGVYNETTYNLIQWNISAPVNNRFNFSNIGFNITAGTTNVLLVVVNLTEYAKGGRTLNASLEGAADVVSTGVSSGVSLTETFTSQRSGTTTIKGNLSVTGANITPSSVDVGQIGVGMLKLTINATGEGVNITSINLTSNNTRNQDVLAVRLFDDIGGSTTGTYERSADLPIAGASGTFGGSSSGSVLLTPTNPINVTMNTLHYVYVVFDINTTATLGNDRLGVSIQAAGAIAATGNDSYIALVPQLLTGDPGAVNVDIKNLSSTATVITTGTATARTEVGTRNNFTFTINNTATGTIKDTIDEIRILFGGTGFTLLGNATCPTIATISWNRTIISANTVVCNVTDNSGYLLADKNTTILLENFTAGATAGFYQMNISVRGASGGVFNVSSNPSITAYGNLTVKATSQVNTTVVVGATRITLMSVNLSAAGERMNVTEILVKLNGTGLVAADVAAVELYNSTDTSITSTALVNSSYNLLRSNVTPSAPDLTYNFSALNLSVPTGTTGQILLVVVNISGSATGGRTVNASITSNLNMVTLGSLTGINSAEYFTGEVNSSSSTIFGNLSVLGASRIASTTRIGTKNVTIISFNFSATGEQMNITGINVTINGSSLGTADIARVGLYNSSAAAAGVLDGSGVNYDLIQWNISEPVITGSSMRFNFSNIGFNIIAGTPNVLLVVVNLSSGATGGRTINASIEGAADIVTTSGTSGQSITESLASQRSSTSTIYGNLTISGTSRVASQTRLGSSNVTIISFNLTAFGEQMNISEIIITRNGTVGNDDIVSVALYNSTKDNAQTFNETGNIDPLAVNLSAPTNGRYNFSGLSLKVPTGNIGQIIMVVFNVSSSASAGRTLNASLEGAADVTTMGAVSNTSITEDFASQRSVTSTLVGMKITGTSRVGATTEIGATNVSVISFTFNASGENMNVTGLNITFNGTITTADIVRVGMYNSTAANAGVYNETTYNLIQWNTSAPVAGAGNTLRYNFPNIAFNVTSGTINTLVVVVNISSSATGGRTFNASIEGDADAIVTGVSSGLAITETYTTQRSSTSTLLGNLSVTGTNRVASYTRLGSNNVTVISYNFSTTGEQMNISEIIVTVNGSSISTADIVSVALYNSTKENAQTFNETGNIDPLAVNLSAPTAGAGSTLRYNFSGLSFKVPSSQIVMVVANISSTATGNRTFNASIESAGDIATTGGVSNTSISETLTTQRSITSTIISFNVSTSSLAPASVSANQTAIAMLNITITALGESMNVTSFNFTLTGNATTGNISDVRLYRDDAAPLGAFTTDDTYLAARGTFNGNAIQINLSVTNYNLSISQGTTRFFVTFNISGTARTLATAGVQLTPSGIAAIGNVSALGISVTGNSVASTNSTILSEANLIIGSITSSYPWITNKTATLNTTNISIPVTNGGASTAALTSVLMTLYNVQTGENASTNFTIVRADSVTSIAGGVTTTLNFTVNATTGAQLVGRVNASVRINYNDSLSGVVATTGPVETNTTGTVGVDGILPVTNITNPVHGGNANGSQVDINFTLNDAGSGINRSAISISINSIARNATCSPSGLNFTCNFTLFSSDSLFVFGSVTARISGITDNATNAATPAEINFTLNNNDGVGNYTFPTGTGSTFRVGWNALNIPHQSVIESTGRNATNTGSFNFTSIMASMGTSWNIMYYNINGSSTGWVLATRTDFAGSTLKYLNNTNFGEGYMINVTSPGMVFKL